MNVKRKIDWTFEILLSHLMSMKRAYVLYPHAYSISLCTGLVQVCHASVWYTHHTVVLHSAVRNCFSKLTLSLNALINPNAVVNVTQNLGSIQIFGNYLG